MKYDKKIAKHFARLNEKDYRTSEGSVYDKTKNLSALLIGECTHFSASGKPIQYAEEDAKNIISGLKKVSADWQEQLCLYGLSLKALSDYKKITGDEALTDAPIRYLSNYILNGIESCMEEICNGEDPFLALSSLEGLSECYKSDKNERAKNLAFSIANIISLRKDDFSGTSSYCYLSFVTALANFAIYSGESAINGVIGGLFDKYCFMAQSLNYECDERFGSKISTDPAGTAKAMELSVLLYHLTGDIRFRMMARRIWFNGMQFCQRTTGGVGKNTFSSGDKNLKVVQYEVKDFVTPLYGLGLKCYAENKELFEESEGTIHKDRNGRILMEDKIFVKDESEFFGHDLIEIPTLTSFDHDVALQLNLKIKF